MGYKYNGSALAIDMTWKDTEGTNYPANWLRNSTATERAAVPSGGVTWEVESQWYDQEFYFGVNNPKDCLLSSSDENNKFEYCSIVCKQACSPLS